MLSNQEPPAAASRPGHEPQCTVCMHPLRSEVDLFLLRSSVRRTAARYGLSKSAVQRHREAHIPELLAAGEQILERRLALAVPKLRARLEEIHAETQDFYHTVKGVENAVAQRTLSLLSRQLEVSLRVAAAAPATPAIGPDAIELFGRALLRTLEPHPEIREKVVTAFREVESQLGLSREAA